MRGKAVSVTSCLAAGRIPPAYAGKSSGAASRSTFQWDHPRLCGEKQAEREEIEKRQGSPPPMRGKVFSRFICDIFERITPAYAGKSQAGSFSAGDNQDHPRLCGEKLLDVNSQKMPLGSPPPMRGKGSIESIIERRIRITPAYAGKSPKYHTVFRAVRDHPRLCGEKQSKRSGTTSRHRITPAYAGKRCNWLSMRIM